ncbi:hypothetical protein [Luteimonas sp. RC10]|uniref:hypothetical protein n=1 Tax=Luteimonas sp. RC10 TaxID=2587035 RepID=UPI0016226584|nr:hypothetical protein [Luteimonas sp. RC10]MBB3343132.1 hypothetical protein [Luteimonas sp. RC10]
MNGLISAGLIVLFLPLLGCHKSLGVEACLDAKSEDVRVRLFNNSGRSIEVSSSSPFIGCCDNSGFSLFVSDSEGVELDRCGFADSFDMDRKVVQSGEGFDYEMSGYSLRRLYCDVDLKGKFLSARVGRGLDSDVSGISEMIGSCE